MCLSGELNCLNCILKEFFDVLSKFLEELGDFGRIIIKQSEY